MELELKKLDKGAVGKRFGASASSYDRAALAQQHIYGVLERMLSRLGRQSFGRALEIGSGTGAFARYIDDRYEVEQWTLNDLSDEMLHYSNFMPRSARPASLILGDAETVDLGGGYDLILSASALQWFHHPELFLTSLRGRLAPEGVLLVGTFGCDNLTEVRQLTGRGLSYREVSAWTSALGGYEHWELEEEHYPLRFVSPREVLRHLKHTGVTAVGSGEGFWSVERLRQFEHRYRQLFRDEAGGVRLTYHPIYMMAW